jgi:hypothetical protein
MTDKTGNTKAKRLSKGYRTHMRRMKQAARKTNTASQALKLSRN